MPANHDTSQDKNFDELAHRFENRVYGRLKGQIRLAVLNRDLEPVLNTGRPMTIFDIGGGQGQLSLSLAQEGHNVTLCDISKKMLSFAKSSAEEKKLRDVQFIHCGLQELSEKTDQRADLVLCHAVLEWMAEPHTALRHLSECIKPNGVLSLAFFNENSIIYKNLVRGNYRKVKSGNFVGQVGGLTPMHPLQFGDVKQWCTDEGFEITDYSGIRVFHDYIANPEIRAQAPEDALELELKYSQIEPFRSLGRYIHIVAKKSS